MVGVALPESFKISKRFVVHVWSGQGRGGGGDTQHQHLGLKIKSLTWDVDAVADMFLLEAGKME